MTDRFSRLRPIVSAVRVAFVVGLLVSGRPAQAAPSLADKAAAQSLFEDGLQLMGSKRFAEACPKLEESERLDPALGTRFRLAECDEALGRRASAWAGYLEVADLAKASGQADREVLARTRASALESQLARIKIVVAAPDTPGIEVTRGGSALGRGQWGTSVTVDAGAYDVSATAPGKKPWHTTGTIPDAAVIVTVTVPALEDAPTAVAPPVASVAVIPAPAALPDEHRGSGQRITGYSLIGVGAAGLVTGTVLGFVAKSNYDGAGTHCGPTSCDASGKSTTDSARSLADVGTVVFVVGAAASVAGVVVVLTAPSSSSRPTAAASLRVGPGAFFLEGTF